MKTAIEIQNLIISLYKQSKKIKDIAKDCNVSVSTIDRVLNKENIERKRETGPKNEQKINFNENYFSKIDSEQKAYWLGFIFADGSVQLRNGSYIFSLNLAKKDGHHIELFNRHIESSHIVKERKVCKSLRITRKKFVKDLIRLGCVPNKTFNLKWPSINKKFYRDFVRGFIDGDGCWGLNKGFIYFSILCADKNFILSLISHIENKCNIKLKLKKRPDENVYRFLCYGNKCEYIYKYLYYDDCLCLKRKQQICSKYFDRLKTFTPI